MHHTKLKRVIALVLLLAVVGSLRSLSIPTARADDGNLFAGLAIASLRQSVQAPEGNKVAFHVVRDWACRSTNGTVPVGILSSRWRPCPPTPTYQR